MQGLLVVIKDEMANRASTRNEINAKSIDKMMAGADKAVNNLLDLLQFVENDETISKKGKSADAQYNSNDQGSS